MSRRLKHCRHYRLGTEQPLAIWRLVSVYSKISLMYSSTERVSIGEVSRKLVPGEDD